MLYRGVMDDSDRTPEKSPEAASAEEANRYPPSPNWAPNTKLMVISMSFVLSVVGLYLVRNVIAIAALAALIAFLVAPLIRLSAKHLRMPRGLALLLAYLVVFLGTIGFGYLMTKSISASIIELDPLGIVEELRVGLLERVNADGELLLVGVTVDMNSILDSLQVSVGTGDGSGGIVIDAERILEYVGAGLSSFRTVIGIVTAVITSAIVTALVAMYINADSTRMHNSTLANIPRGYERDGLRLMAEVKRVWRGYLYGQLVNSLITGTLVFAVLWAVGLPGAFLMGAIMVVLNMIPTFGPILAAIPGVLTALLSGSTRWPELENYWFALIVAGIYLLVVQLQANIIAPKVMGTAVRLRPAIVLLGLMIGFQVGGLLGSLLAVPVIASIRDVAVYVWRKLIDVDPWPDDDVDEAVSEP
jgi:predicted PurR-regulated permease PerM